MVKRSVAAIVLVTMMPQLAGCMSWIVRPSLSAPAIVDSTARDVRIRLLADNSAWVLQRAQIVGDSIVGVLKPEMSTEHARRVAFAVSDVRDVAVAEPSPGKTLLLIAGFGALWAAVAIVAKNALSGPGISWK